MAEVTAIPCPLCANTSSFLDVRVPSRDDHIRSYGALYDGLDISQWKICGRCGFVHQNPRPSAEALDRFYLAGDYHSKIDVPPDRLFAEHAPFYRDEVEYAIARSGLATGTVFDVGCGLGVALKLFQDRGWTVYGVEPDRGRFEYARDHYGLANIKQGTLDARFEHAGQVDMVFTHHAFEHFADLSAVMTAITRILKPGGFMFTAIPTFRCNRSTMSKLWMNSAHYSLFTHRSFNQLLARHGFEEIAHRYNPWHSGPDQFGHLARFTGTKLAPESFYEDATEVARYLRFVNPLRSAVFLPLIGGYRGYRHHATMAFRAARQAGHILRTRPDELISRATAHLRRK
jgi:2-polyprenyl-3-methyl-5-hydroxy-6-metoxy-1,4-benzoquinol methylase